MFRKNTASQFIHVQGVDSATGGIKSGVTWTVRRCIDGTFAAATGTATEDGATGWYKFALSQADTNGNDIGFNFTGTGAVPQTINIVTTAADPTDAADFGLTNLDAAISSRMATYTQPTGFLAATFPSGTVANTTNITAGTVTTATNVTTVNGLAANVITATSINTGAITAAKFAAGAIDAAAIATGAIDADALAADAVAEIADGVWDEDATGHQTQGTFGQAIGDPGADTDTIWGLVNTNLDAAVSSRMATYTQPTGFLAATFPGGTIANTTNITAGTITTTTNLTNLPSIPANWLTAAGTAADFGAEMATAIWTDTTAGDFTVALSVGKSVMNGVALGTGLTINAYTGNTPQTGDAYARLGAPAGASVSADIAAVPTDVENADALLNRNIAGGGSGSSRNVRNALRASRNKAAIVAGTLTVYEEDDTTTAWTAAVTTAPGDPLNSIDPA